MKHNVQFPGAVSSRLVEFFAGANIPAPLTSPLTAADCANFLDEDRIASFTLGVPLDIIALGGLAEYVREQAFDFPVDLRSLEYQAVGASFDADGFDQEFTGDVHLRVTCGICTAEVEV